MTTRREMILALIIAACLILSGLMVMAWPATASPDPTITPATYNPPGPNGGPQ